MNGNANLMTDVPAALGAAATGPWPGGVRLDGAMSLGRPRIPLIWLWHSATLCHVDTRARPSKVTVGWPVRSDFSSEEYAS